MGKKDGNPDGFRVGNRHADAERLAAQKERLDAERAAAIEAYRRRRDGEDRG